MKKKILLATIACLAFGSIFTTIPVSAEEVNTEAQEEISESKNLIDKIEEQEVEDEALSEMLENNPLTDENVEKGRTIWQKIVDAVIPFIKSFLLALYEFFVAIGRAIYEGIKSI